jgi:hypothetical protein
MLHQLASVAGAIMVLLAYLGYQRNWMSKEQPVYNLLNLVGSALLAWVAIVDRRWGFILLEVIWALLSVPPLVAMARSRSRDTANGGG